MIVVRVTSLPFSETKPALLRIRMTGVVYQHLKLKYAGVSDLFFSNLAREYLRQCELRLRTPVATIDILPLLSFVGRDELALQIRTLNVDSTPKKRIL